MKILIILILIINLYAEKTVKIKLNNYNDTIKYKFTYTNPLNQTNYLEDERGTKFFLKNEFPKGKTVTAKTTQGRLVNGKIENKTEFKNYKIYELMCIKEKETYFDCIEAD